MRRGRHIVTLIALLCMLLAAGESSPAATTATISVSVYLDDSRPAVTMTSPSPDATNVSLIPVTVQFSEPVFGFDAGDVIISNAVLADFAGSDANYSFHLIPEGEGGVTADIPDGAARDGAGNLNTASDQFVRVYDTTPPTGTLLINGDAVLTRDVGVSLAFSTDDGAGSGVTRMSFRNAGGVWYPWGLYAPSRAWTLENGQGYKTVEARCRDAAGNVSVVEIADTIALDTEPLAVNIAGPSPVSKAQHTSHLFESEVVGLFGNPSYQWYKEKGSSKDFVAVLNATEPAYPIAILEMGDSGSYYVEVSDDTETALSPATVLIVQSALPAAGVAGICVAAVLLAATGAYLLRRVKRAPA